jgi:hypothetical protein
MSPIDPRSISQLLDSLPGAHALINFGFQVLGANKNFYSYVSKESVDAILRSPDVRVFVTHGKTKRMEIKLPQPGSSIPMAVRLLLMSETRDDSAIFFLEVETEQSRIAAFRNRKSDPDESLKSVRDLSTALLARVERCRRGLHEISTLAAINPEIRKHAESGLEELEKISELGRKLFEAS